MNFQLGNKKHKAEKWEKHDKRRVYIKVETGFKNRPWEAVGYYDLDSREFVPAKGYNFHAWNALAQFEQDFQNL